MTAACCAPWSLAGDLHSFRLSSSPDCGIAHSTEYVSKAFLCSETMQIHAPSVWITSSVFHRVATDQSETLSSCRCQRVLYNVRVLRSCRCQRVRCNVRCHNNSCCSRPWLLTPALVCQQKMLLVLQPDQSILLHALCRWLLLNSGHLRTCTRLNYQQLVRTQYQLLDMHMAESCV